MIYVFKVIHYYLQMYLKILDASSIDKKLNKSTKFRKNYHEKSDDRY